MTAVTHNVFITETVGDSANLSVTDSGWDSYLDDEEETIADIVSKFVLRFVDRVGTEAGIRTEHMKSLYAMIPGGSIVLFLFIFIFIYLFHFLMVEPHFSRVQNSYEIIGLMRDENYKYRVKRY